MIEKILLKVLDWLDSTKAWEIFFKTLNKYNVRIQGYTEFPMHDYFKIIDLSEPESHYIFLSTDAKSLSSYIIKGAVKTVDKAEGYFSHAGLIFFKGDRNTTVLHVRDIGLVEQPMVDFLKQIDYMAVIKLPLKKGMDQVLDIRVQDLRKRAKYVEYDWSQHLDNDQDKLYCSELIYDLFKDIVDDPNFQPRLVLGRQVFDPDLLLKCGRLIYNNHPKIPKTPSL